jgi:hypothetical protein
MNTEGSTKREQIIEGLRAIADFYEQHPDVPLPPFPSWSHCVLSDDDTQGQVDVAAVATALDVPMKVKDGSADAKTKFGGVRFHVYYVSRQRAENYADNLRFLAEHGRGE